MLNRIDCDLKEVASLDNKSDSFSKLLTVPRDKHKNENAHLVIVLIVL